jgi:hypothetical protein
LVLEVLLVRAVQHMPMLARQALLVLEFLHLLLLEVVLEAIQIMCGVATSQAWVALVVVV